MCGIAGIIGPDANIKVLKELLEPIIHRGEIRYRYEADGVLGCGVLGVHRLAIVDEEHGKQPIIDLEREIYCVFNGEIYNYKEMWNILSNKYSISTQCDSEIILYAYLNWGDEFVRYLDGMFAIAIFDIRKNILLLARDPMGIKPLYYSNVGNNVLFASEIKALSKKQEALKGREPQKIHEIKPGTTWINNNVKSYFTIQKFSNSQKNNSPIQTICLKKCLMSVIDKHIPKGDSKIACLLSGGIDSSIITYLSSKIHPYIVAYTLAAPNVPSEDLEAARELCKKLDIEHIIVAPTIKEMQQFYLDYGVYMTESFESILVRNAVSYYFLCKQVVKDGFKFCLNGEGADELFGGYDFVMEAPDHERDSIIWYSLSIIHETYLKMADRASMFVTLEARVPYMNEKLVSYCLTLPPDFRIKGNKNKVILRELYKKELPSIVTERKKVGMNEGSGYGKNVSENSIYYHAVRDFYNNSFLYQRDLRLCRNEKVRYNVHLNLDDLEEIYNFARYTELGYLKLENGTKRLQLNTNLNRLLVV